MMYVIKAPNEPQGPYVSVENNAESFAYSSKLEVATLFDSISDAIAAIITREWWWGIKTGDTFTIAGVEEVSAPRYREVSL